jgi:predicted ester cyclase
MQARHRETGREAEIDGLVILRVADGRIAEEWSSWDYLGLAKQLGLAEVA